MTTYKAPDVYVEEISLLPPSVAEVETAIPAFIGFTERALRKGVNDVRMVPTEITSFLDYEATFGGAPPVNVKSVEFDLNNAVTKAEVEATFYLYDSIRLFFQNGGGKCYIVSIGSYAEKENLKKEQFIKGLEALRTQDEPTIILFPDAVLLGEDLYFVQQQALKQCGELMDRVAVLDLLESKKNVPEASFGWAEGYKEFRSSIGINYLKYGAAYTPYLKTSLEKKIRYQDIAAEGVLKKAGVGITLQKLTDDKEIQALIANIEAVLADNRLINGDGDQHAGDIADLAKSINAPSLKAGYLQKVLEFKSAAVVELAKKPEDRDADTARGKFKELFVYIYNVADQLLDQWAKTGTKLTDDPPPANADDPVRQTVVKEVRTLISGPVAAALLALNRWNKKMNLKVGGAADAVNELYTKDHTWSAAAWGNTFVSDKIVEDNAIYPFATDSHDEHEVTEAQIRNMQAAEGRLSEQFQVLQGAIDLIAAGAGQYVKVYEEALAEKFPLFRSILAKVATALTIVPPSGVIAGIYAMVDRNRGVWKAPANVSLSSIVDVTKLIDSRQQEELNVDVVSGKSINVIRPFTGKGILVWGARTLAGNDNEWRYVSVRRFFNMVEESVKKSTYWAVFEPNDANTWVKVRGMIENYLLQKWREGALAGATPKDAFFVRCGLGTTMNSQDILEGRMIVEIGMAVVRPAEFIILKFSHLLQTS